MSLLYQQDIKKGLNEIIKEESKQLDYLSLSFLKLDQGEVYSGNTESKEIGMVILGGTCSVKVKNIKWDGLGERKNVFDGKATALYLPCKSSYTIKAETSLEVAFCKSRADQELEPQLIKPDDIIVNKSGELNWKRDVCEVIGVNNSSAQHLIVGETYAKSGNWASYPPHKHDVDNLPEEVAQEEIYHYRFDPEQGFGVQFVYSDDKSINEAYRIQNKSTVVIPEGYHPLATAPGYQIYYLWFMAGKKRIMRPYDDPGHRWIKDAEKVID